jgi:hypothetical protein
MVIKDVGEESDNQQQTCFGPSMNNVITALFDDSAFKLAVTLRLDWG